MSPPLRSLSNAVNVQGKWTTQRVGWRGLITICGAQTASPPRSLRNVTFVGKITLQVILTVSVVEECPPRSPRRRWSHPSNLLLFDRSHHPNGSDGAMCGYVVSVDTRWQPVTKANSQRSALDAALVWRRSRCQCHSRRRYRGLLIFG